VLTSGVHSEWYPPFVFDTLIRLGPVIGIGTLPLVVPRLVDCLLSPCLFWFVIILDCQAFVYSRQPCSAAILWVCCFLLLRISVRHCVEVVGVFGRLACFL